MHDESSLIVSPHTSKLMLPHISYNTLDTSLNYQHEPGGTTAVAVLIKESTIFCVSPLFCLLFILASKIPLRIIDMFTVLIDVSTITGKRW